MPRVLTHVSGPVLLLLFLAGVAPATVSFSNNALTYGSPNDLDTTIDPPGLHDVQQSYGLTKAAFQALNPQVVAFSGAPAATQTLRTLAVQYDASSMVTFTFPAAMYNYGSYTTYGRGGFSGSDYRDAMSTVPLTVDGITDWLDATITTSGSQGVQALGFCTCFRNDQPVAAGEAVFTLSDATTETVTLPALGGGDVLRIFIGYQAPPGKTITRVQASRTGTIGGAWVAIDDLSFVMSPDTTVPAAVSDLVAGSPTSDSLTLTWTAPGDDDSTGTASNYDIRYSTSAINEGNWASATQVTGEPTPAAAGASQSMIVSGLTVGTTYYFALKTVDEASNVSALSNVASGPIQGVILADMAVTGRIVHQPFGSQRACDTAVSCTATIPVGTVQSVTVDLSQIGGSASQTLTQDGSQWTWSGPEPRQVIPLSSGLKTVTFTATSNTGAVTTDTADVEVLENIARGHSYTFSKVTDYSDCRDDGDYTQLTDGGYATRVFWYSEGNTKPWVGWRTSSSSPWIVMTIDLGGDQPIAGACFSAGLAIGPFIEGDWPLAVNVLVSEDDVHYYDVGELTSLDAEHLLPPYTLVSPDPPTCGPRPDQPYDLYCDIYKTHSYWTNRLDTHGRYVRIVAANQPYVFVDEIEVYGGHPGMDSRGQLVDSMGLAAYVGKSKIRSGIIRRIAMDAWDVWSQVHDAQIESAEKEYLEDELTTIVNEATSLGEQDLYKPGVTQSTFRAILPLNDLHAQVFKALAGLRRAQGSADVVVWQNPSIWDPATPTQEPWASQAAVNVTVMQGEYRAGAFNVSNAAVSDVTAHLSVDFDDPSIGTNPSFITVHEVAWTDTKRGVPVAAALPVVPLDSDGTFHINIPSGMTRQVWLTFHPTSVNPKTYNGHIAGTYSYHVDGETQDHTGSFSVGVQMRVSALQFQNPPTLSLGGWDYTSSTQYSGMTLQNREAFISHLQDHFVDTTWGLPEVMPYPSASQPFEAWRTLWPNARNYRVFLSAGETLGGYQMGTDEFNREVAAWMSYYRQYWADKNVNLSRIGLLVRDEPADAGKANTIKTWAAAIKKWADDAQIPADQRVLVWENPGFANPYSTTAQDLFRACDVLCPNRLAFLYGTDLCSGDDYRKAYRAQRSGDIDDDGDPEQPGKTLNFYSCAGPSRWLDPYSYYRLQAWTCWDEDATGMFFWAFGDTGGGSAWNEYSSANNYSPIYLDPDDSTVTAGKHMEAIREGVEDYEYLAMLQRRVDELIPIGNNSSVLREAQVLLDRTKTNNNRAAGQVLSTLSPTQEETHADRIAWSADWSGQKTRTIADTKRIEVLDKLEALSAIVKRIREDTQQTYPTIQSAIDAASDGDTIQLGLGTYHERINFGGKNITLCSVDPHDPATVAATIIDGDTTGTVVTFSGSETTAVLDGLTIANSTFNGIEGSGTGATIRNCIIRDNYFSGIYQVEGLIDNCVVRHNTNTGLNMCGGTIRNCTVVGNVGGNGGGFRLCEGTIENCLIAGNYAYLSGGGIYGNAAGGIRGCTIIGNQAPDYRGGGAHFTTGNPGIPGVLENCIVYGNSAYLGNQLSLALGSSSSLTVRYGDIQGGQSDVYVMTGTLSWDSGNIDASPAFLTGYSFSSSQNARYDSGADQTTLTLSGSLGTNNLVGQIVDPDLTQGLLFVVASQTDTTLTVWGDASAIAQTGEAGAVVMGHLTPAVSPCIGAGNPNGTYTGQTDIDGEARVQGTVIDIGADEVPD